MSTIFRKQRRLEVSSRTRWAFTTWAEMSGNGAPKLTREIPARPGRDWGVLRGGSWATSNRLEMQSSYRNVVDRNERDVIYGFRCVLAAELPIATRKPLEAIYLVG